MDPISSVLVTNPLNSPGNVQGIQQLKSNKKPHLISKIINFVYSIFIYIGSVFYYFFNSVYTFLKNKVVKAEIGKNENIKPANNSSINLAKVVLNPLEKDSQNKYSDVFQKLEENPPVDYNKVAFQDSQILGHNGIDIRGKKWLDNLHINAFICEVMDEYPKLFRSTTYFVAFNFDVDNGKEHFFDKVIKRFNESDAKDLKENIFAYPLLVSDDHYTLVIVDQGKKTVEYYDSKSNYGNHEHVVSCLSELAGKLSESDKNSNKPYTFVKKITTSLQPDSYQCGVWACYFLEQRLKKPDFDFNQLNVAKVQKQIASFRLYVMDKLVKRVEKITEKQQKSQLANS